MEGYLSHTFKDKDGKEFTVPFFIGVYSLEKSLEELDASLSDLGELLNKKFMPLIRLYMFYSAEYMAFKNKQDFPYTKFDVYDWIDQTGGTDGEFYSKFSIELIKALGLTSKEKEPEAEQKKSLRKSK